MDFNTILARLKAIESDPCVTITTNATGTYANASVVRELLKKAARDAEQVLRQHYDKHLVIRVMDRLRGLIAKISGVDERPGLALFVTADHAEMVHLPFRVQERVTVGSSFFTRELLRAGLESVTYQVLVLTADEARLYEAQDAHLLHEVRGEFPLRNTHYTTDAVQVTTSSGQVDQAVRYYKAVDTAVRNTVGRDGTVIVACVHERYGEFIKTVSVPGMYIGNLKGSFDHVPEREMIAEAWEQVYFERKRQYLSELVEAASTPPRLSNLVDDIWEQVREGRGHVLYVERDKHQAAMLEDDHAVLLGERLDHEPGIDLIDAIIEEQIGHGGEIRIVPNGALEQFGGIALKPRY